MVKLIFFLLRKEFKILKIFMSISESYLNLIIILLASDW